MTDWIPATKTASCSRCGAEEGDDDLAVVYLVTVSGNIADRRPPVELECRACFLPDDQVKSFELCPHLSDLRAGTWPYGIWQHRGFYDEADKNDE